MITAIIVIALLVVLVITIRLVSKSLYRERKTTNAFHTNKRVCVKSTPHAVRTTMP